MQREGGLVAKRDIHSIIEDVNAPIAHLAVAGVPVPMPVVMNLVAVNWLILGRTEPQIIVQRFGRFQWSRSASNRLARAKSTNLHVSEGTKRLLPVYKLLYFYLHWVAALLCANLHNTIKLASRTNKLLPLPMIVG